MIRPGIRRLLRLPIRRPDVAEREVDEEVRLHLELRAEQLERQGMSREEAWTEARRRFGVGEGGEDERALRRAARRRESRLHGREWWAGVGRDFRHATRTLRRRPLFASGVAGTIALGVAAAMVAFAVTWSVWLSPMGYPDPERVVRLYELAPPAPESGVDEESRRHQLSTTLLGDLNEHTWETIEAFSWSLTSRPTSRMSGGALPMPTGLTLSPEGFEVLGIRPIHGRVPVNSEREVMLTEQYWRSEFGGDPGIVGSEVPVGARTLSVVGVGRMPSIYAPDVDAVYLMDWAWTEAEDREFRFYEAIAKLRPGRTVAEAEAELNAFVASLAEVHPVHRGWTMDVVVLSDDIMRPFRSVLALLLAGGVIFLLLAAVNVTGVVAARRIEGREERAVRLALGASEGRLLWGSISESIVLVAIGTTAGVLIAVSAMGPIRMTVPSDLPRLSDIGITPAVVLGAAGFGLLLSIVVGLAGYLVARPAKPAVGRAPFVRAVGAGGRRALVVGQVALTTLLTAGGLAILHRVTTLRGIDLGYQPEGVTTTSTFADERPYSRSEFPRMVQEALRSRGLDAAVALNTPMRGADFPRPAMRASPDSPEVVYDYHLVTPNYFSVMGIEMLAGRDFGPQDGPDAQRAVIVSERFVDEYFGPGTPPQEVVGRSIAPLMYETELPRIAGVVESTRHRSPELPVEPEIYSAYSQFALPSYTVLVRGEPDEVADVLAPALMELDPGLVWTPIVPYTSFLSEWYGPLRLQILLTAILGGVGLLLSSLGLYALMAYGVVSRRRELGVRKALGSSELRLMREVLSSGSTVAAIGAAIGLTAWYGLVPRAEALIEGLGEAGAVVPIGVALVVGGCCVLATLMPAFRAARVDPAVTLKAE